MRGDKPTSPVILQRLTDELYRETTPVFIDEPDYFLTFWAWFRREKLKQPSEAYQRRVAGDVHGVASRFRWPKFFRHGSWDASYTAGLLKSIDGQCAMKPPALELVPGTRLASTNFSAKMRSSTRRTTRSLASWSYFLGMFQIFPSTQTEQNLGHFIRHAKSLMLSRQDNRPSAIRQTKCQANV